MPSSPARTPRRAVVGWVSHFSAEDEAYGRDEVRERDEHAVAPRGSRRRSPPRRSPASEHLEHAVGDQEAADHVDRRGDRPRSNPRTVAIAPRPAPARMSDPTSEMPEIAFVSDISGVCSSGGTRVITSIADERREHEDAQPELDAIDHVTATSSRAATNPLVARSRRPVRPASPRTISSSQSGSSAVLPPAAPQEVREVPRVHLARVERHARGQVRRTEDRHAVRRHDLVRTRERAVAPARRGESTITDPGACPRTASSVSRIGRGRPGISARWTPRRRRRPPPAPGAPAGVGRRPRPAPSRIRSASSASPGSSGSGTSLAPRLSTSSCAAGRTS